MKPIPGRWTFNWLISQISMKSYLDICRVSCERCETHWLCYAALICASCGTHCQAPQGRPMVRMVFLSLSDSLEGWNNYCVPGQITYRAGTLATLARCRSQW